MNVPIQTKIFSLILLALFTSCSPEIPGDGDLIKWSTIVEIPLFRDSLTLKTLANDSLIHVEELSNYFQDGNSSDSIFVYNKKVNIDKVLVGERLEIDPVSKSYSQDIDDVKVAKIEKVISSEVGIISLNDLEPINTDPFIFRDIFPNIEDINTGTMAAVPSFEIVPIVKPLIFEDFESADFSDGTLELTINNNMVIPIGSPILIELLHVIGNDTFTVEGTTSQFDEIIEANSGSATKIIDLSSVTLPGEVLVKVSGNCQGTLGIEILVNEEAKNSGFDVVISGSELKVTGANAKIPQQLIEANGNILLAPDSNKVVEALIENGQLLIEIDNYMNVSNTINISIPNLLDPGGNIFSTSLYITENTLGIINQSNLNSYSILMDSEDQSIEYNYNILTTDSGDDFILVESIDSINVKISLEGIGQDPDISFSYFTGFLSQEAMYDSNTIDIETATKLDQATINSGNLTLSVTNDIGIEAIVNFTLNELSKNGTKLDTSFPISDQPSLIQLELEGYELNLDIESDPQPISYISSIDIPSDELVSLAFGESITIDVTIDSISFSEISGYVDPVIVEIDSIKQNIDLPEEINKLDFSNMNLDFSFQSSLDLPVKLNLELLSINDESEEFHRMVINDINITETPSFSINNAEQLFNIKPNRFIATGSTEVGSLDELGYVTSSDSLSGSLNIVAPLAFQINEDSEIDIGPEQFSAINIEDLVSAKLFVDYENNLKLGADIIIIMATDTNLFYNGNPDTLAELFLGYTDSHIDSVILDETHFDILRRENNYSMVKLKLLGDDNGSVRFLSTDTLKYSIYLSSEILLDPNASK